MLGGLPTEPPVDSTGLLRNVHVSPLSPVMYASMKCAAPSLRRSIVRMVVGDNLTDDGIMENPAGSGPIHPIASHVLPPSIVRMHNTRPSRPSSFDPVMNAVHSRLPSTM